MVPHIHNAVLSNNKILGINYRWSQLFVLQLYCIKKYDSVMSHSLKTSKELLLFNWWLFNFLSCFPIIFWFYMMILFTIVFVFLKLLEISVVGRVPNPPNFVHTHTHMHTNTDTSPLLFLLPCFFGWMSHYTTSNALIFA